MANPEDAVLPILRNIQSDTSALRAKLDNVGEAVMETRDRVERLEGLITWHLGLTNEQKHDIEVLQAEMKDLQKRVSALETRP